MVGCLDIWWLEQAYRFKMADQVPVDEACVLQNPRDKVRMDSSANCRKSPFLPFLCAQLLLSGEVLSHIWRPRMT